MGMWGRGASRDEVEALHDELARLSQENMRLRLEQQRPLSLGRLAEKLEQAGQVAHSTGQPASAAGDDAHQALAQALVVQSAVVDVLQTLQVATAQLQRQLAGGIPAMELDRRVVSRRRPADGNDHRGGRVVAQMEGVGTSGAGPHPPRRPLTSVASGSRARRAATVAE